MDSLDDTSKVLNNRSNNPHDADDLRFPQDWNWQLIFFPLTCMRGKVVFWVVGVLAVVGTLSFGFKDAGSYMGFTAGSILQPDRYYYDATNVMSWLLAGNDAARASGEGLAQSIND